MFFGVTKLGTQNSFKDNLKHSSLLGCFSDAEYTAAYDRIAAKTDGVRVKDVPAVLAIVYRGPAPETDAGRVQTALGGREADAPLPLEEFMTILKAAQEDEKTWDERQLYIVSEGSEFGSSKFYRDHITRHERMDKEPNEKYRKPITGSMEVGWRHSEAVAEPRRGKKSCPETVYAAELYKAGVYY